MRRLPFLMLVLATGMAAAACDDDPADVQGMDPDTVVGLWHATTLTFDVQGSLPEKDLLAHLDSAEIPRVVLFPNRDAQYQQYDTFGGVKPFEGRFTTLENGIRLTFPNANPQDLLIPKTLELVLDTDSTLVFSAQVSMSRPRLKELVPEFENEPLADPVPGFLRVVLTRRD